MLKKAGVVVCLLLGLISNAKAVDTKVSFGSLDLVLPFVQAEGVYLYDVIGKRGLAGVETIVAKYKKIEAGVGVVTNYELEGAPFLGLRYLVPSGIFKDSFYIGIWGGRDFRRSEYQFGLKASVPLWGKK